MSQRTIVVGSSANSGGGDPLRDAFIKVNDNFTEVYAKLTALEDGNIITDVKGNVFADDSTLLVDGINGKIVGPIDTADNAYLRGYVKLGTGSSDRIDINGLTYFSENVSAPTVIDVTNIVSGASPDQNLYISTTSGGTTYTNIAVKYSSVYTAPINELMGATVVEELKVGNTIEIAYAPTILASTNPGTSTKIDMDIMAGSDNTSGPVKGQINIGENNTEVINIGTTGIASAINIGDDFSPSTTTINGDLALGNATITTWNNPDVVNTHGGGTWITVDGQEATIDNLTVRIVNDGSNNLDLQFNYDPDATAGISASGDTDNRFSGLTSLAPGNTTWTTLNSITTVGTTRTFTVTDHGFHKVYRGTVVSHAMPDGGPTVGDAYCILERLL